MTGLEGFFFFPFFFPLSLPCWVWFNIFCLWFILVLLPHKGAFTIHLSLKKYLQTEKAPGCTWPKECQAMVWLCSPSTPTRDICEGVGVIIVIDFNTKDQTTYPPTWDGGVFIRWSETSCCLIRWGLQNTCCTTGNPSKCHSAKPVYEETNRLNKTIW